MLVFVRNMLIPLFMIGFLAACASGNALTGPRHEETSLAQTLFSIETRFDARKAAGDAVGMARAARTRLEVLDMIEPSGAAEGIEGQSRASRRREAIETGAFEMVRAARALARDDPDALSRIDRLFPQAQMAQSGRLGDFSGLVGERRAVEITIGLEIDATLVPNASERLQLPVDGAEGTTIFVQPVGRLHADLPIELSMRVKLLPVAPDTTEPVCSPRDRQGRLSCHVAPGEHTGVEISLTNHSRFRVPVLIFVSGNAASVTTALAQE
jgi:hypothetical protein